jgi:hypothetical protein
MCITKLLSKVKGLGLPQKELRSGLVTEYMYHEFACRSNRFRVAPKGILFGADGGVCVL